MSSTAIYTGTFDPFHTGHAQTLREAYRAHPFDRLVVGLHYNNPDKPEATDFSHRANIVKIGVRAAGLPFEAEVQPLYHGPFENFLQKHAPGDKLIRIVGSDTIVTTIKDGHLSRLPLCHYLITVRPQLTNREELESVINGLPDRIKASFSFEILPTPASTAEARKIRPNIQAGYAKGLLTPDVIKYIEEHSLY